MKERERKRERKTEREGEIEIERDRGRARARERASEREREEKLLGTGKKRQKKKKKKQRRPGSRERLPPNTATNRHPEQKIKIKKETSGGLAVENVSNPIQRPTAAQSQLPLQPEGVRFELLDGARNRAI